MTNSVTATLAEYVLMLSIACTHACTHTRTHTQPFYSSLNFVWDNPGQLVPEGTFCHLLDFLVQNEDNIGRHTNNLD